MFQRISLFVALTIGSRCSCFVVLTPQLKSSRLGSVPADFEAMTVKDLRQLLKDSTILERGVMSKLKRKQDIIGYLQQNLPPSDVSLDNRELTPPPPPMDPSPEPSKPFTTRVRTGTMPQLKSPSKDDMFEYVYDQYPPLREENCTGLADDDVRQAHHPMLKAATYSDMDVITLGTASCSPGITRGVSCTALRLHWQRRYLPTSGGPVVEQTSFQGGTWLFDVGECTQVSLMWRVRNMISRNAREETRMLAPVRVPYIVHGPLLILILQTF
jgi:hypothetical protein